MGEMSVSRNLLRIVSDIHGCLRVVHMITRVSWCRAESLSVTVGLGCDMSRERGSASRIKRHYPDLKRYVI